MNPNLAEEHLQTIRLLMERSALYRRALAPMMLMAGILGLLAAIIGLSFHLEGSRAFAGLWLGTACVVIICAFLLARRQALKDHEPLWSPPTRRVGQAMLPPLLSGLFLSGVLALVATNWVVDFPMALVWLLFYGCALHSAGFFMERGIKWFGWIFIVAAVLLVIVMSAASHRIVPSAGNWSMGILFGGLHLAYGSYLYFTEKKSSAA
jgi:hypothetical protein